MFIIRVTYCSTSFCPRPPPEPEFMNKKYEQKGSAYINLSSLFSNFYFYLLDLISPSRFSFIVMHRKWTNFKYEHLMKRQNTAKQLTDQYISVNDVIYRYIKSILNYGLM